MVNQNTTESFTINGLGGEKSLSGDISVGGAKNAALPALASAVLFNGSFQVKNVPNIIDIARMKDVLQKLGISINQTDDHTYDIAVTTSLDPVIDTYIGEQMRASIILTGPLLARCGEVQFPHPGGCVIGERPIDLFLDGYKAMGAEVQRNEDGIYTVTAPDGGLSGAEIFFDIPSHTATETLMMTAVLAEGETVLKNCSMEPEIVDVAQFLISCGAEIEGVGTPTMRIKGGDPLSAKEDTHTVMPDRLAAGSFMIIGALCAEHLTIHQCNPEHLEIVIRRLRDAGVPIATTESTIIIEGNTKDNSTFDAFDIKTHKYPGYPTDLQAPSVVFLTQASGRARVFETIFEGRLHYIDDLVAMGADIEMWDPHRIQVTGPETLSGRRLEGPDIRAGLAYIIAALVAEGESVITNIEQIDRGYEGIEEKLQSIGAEIAREVD